MRSVGLLSSAILLAIQLVPTTSQTGAVSGRVEFQAAPPRQVVSRYPSPGGAVQRSIDPIPTVVYIDGPVAGAAAWPRPARAVIVQKDLRFSPSLQVVPRGSSISFPNEDSDLHNVFSYSKAKRFDLGRYPRGESRSVVFDKPGIVKIYCEVHPWMRAAVLVLDSPYFAVVSGDGSFSIRGIPAGRYELVAWNIDAGSKKVPVDVAAGKAPEVLIQLSGRFELESAEQFMLLGALAARIESPADALPEGACCAGKH